MSTFTQDVAQVLDGVRRPGDFSIGGTCDLLAPSIAVEGVGPVALPLLAAQAAEIIATAARRPCPPSPRCSTRSAASATFPA